MRAARSGTFAAAAEEKRGTPIAVRGRRDVDAPTSVLERLTSEGRLESAHDLGDSLGPLRHGDVEHGELLAHPSRSAHSAISRAAS